MLLHHKDFTLQESDSVAAALEQYRSCPRLGFSDCLILEIARKAGHLPLGTFDRNFSKLEGAERLYFKGSRFDLLNRRRFAPAKVAGAVEIGTNPA
jgi:hypothetical protein